MPFQPPPGAHWLLLGPDVQPRRTGYDFARAAEAMRVTTYPPAEAPAVREGLNPPAKEESPQMSAGVELT